MGALYDIANTSQEQAIKQRQRDDTYCNNKK